MKKGLLVHQYIKRRMVGGLINNKTEGRRTNKVVA